MEMVVQNKQEGVRKSETAKSTLQPGLSGGQGRLGLKRRRRTSMNYSQRRSEFQLSQWPWAVRSLRPSGHVIQILGELNNL